LYKALIEMAPTRAEFLSRLFSCPQPRSANDNEAPAEILLDRYSPAMAGNEKVFAKNVRDVLDLLEHRHGFTLTADDDETIEFVYRAFFEYGPSLTYAPALPPSTVGLAFVNFGRFPTYADLM